MPEVKETERKSRGPAEASDTQMDGTGMEGGALRGACPLWVSRLSLAEVEEGDLPTPQPT